MDFDHFLNHRITITPVTGQDADGDSIMGTAINSVQCLIQGDRRRTIDNKGMEIQHNYRITFNKTTLNSFSNMIGFQVSNGQDNFGNTILVSGRIVNFQPFHHPDEGPVTIEVGVTLN